VLRARILTALVAIPFLLWMIHWGPSWFLSVFVLFMTFVALREFAAMALKGVSGGTTMVTVGGMTIAVTMGLMQSGTAVSAGIVACLVSVMVGTLWTAREMQQSVNTAGQILLGCLYAGVLLPHFIWVRALPETGPGWVTLVLAVVMAGDAGGYFGGRTFGKRKLWPQVSPNKTVEGAASSFGMSVLVGCIFNLVASPHLGYLESLLVCGIINVLAQLGDLLESMLKRAYDANDSGWIFPGHGGVLDRTDSLVLPIVFVYYYAILASEYFASGW
jgi:phosphatidate cytidylyltransferase